MAVNYFKTFSLTLGLILVSSPFTSAVDTDCWSFVWPGPYNWQALNVTATCDGKDIMGGDETPTTGGGGGGDDENSRIRLRFGSGVTVADIGQYMTDRNDENSIIGFRQVKLRAFGDEEDVIIIDPGVPCDEPVVFTQNNSRPDVDAMLEMFNLGQLPNTVRCSRVGDQWCVKWTHYQNSDGKPIGISRFCAHARQSKPEGKEIRPGCYMQEFERYKREVCFCDNENLCNGANHHQYTPFTLITFVSFTAIWTYFKQH